MALHTVPEEGWDEWHYIRYWKEAGRSGAMDYTGRRLGGVSRVWVVGLWVARLEPKYGKKGRAMKGESGFLGDESYRGVA